MKTYKIEQGFGKTTPPITKEFYLKSDVVARDAKMKKLLLELSRLYCDKRFKELELLLEG